MRELKKGLILKLGRFSTSAKMVGFQFRAPSYTCIA
jgi:hypothetical protein